MYKKLGIPEEFYLLLKPAGSKCNLNCTYCFYKGNTEQDQNIDIMPKEILENLIKSYLSLNLPISVFCWQGGEPLIAGYKFFKQVIDFQIKYSSAQQSIANSVQTNGFFLNEDYLKLFSEYQFLLGISLDGPEEIHNNYRITKDNMTSFSQTMHAIEKLIKYNIPFNILTSIHKKSINNAHEIYKWFKRQGFRNIQLLPIYETDDSGKVYDYSVREEEYEKFLLEIFDLWKHDMQDISLRPFSDFLNVRYNNISNNCRFENKCNKCFVIEKNGDVYPCDFFVEQEWKLGNISSSSFKELFESKLFQKFAMHKNELPEECLQCKYLKICNGGCPKYRDSKTQKSIFCNAYKKIYQTFQNI